MTRAAPSPATAARGPRRAGALGLVVAGLALGCDPNPKEPAGPDPAASAGPERRRADKDPPPVLGARVETATVGETSARLELALPGEIEGSKQAMVASAQGGYVERVFVEVGDDVAAGKLLARIDSRVYGAQTALTRVELEDSERELARLEPLEDSLPRAQIDAARTRVERARAQHRVQAIASARTKVVAPFAGTIAAVGVERGEVAAPGAPVVRLIQLDPIKVTVAVPDRELVGLRVGDPAQVVLGALAEQHEGTIVRLSPAADLQTRSFEVEIQLANPERRLLPGMMATVRLGLRAPDGALLIPQDFLVTRLDGSGVFVVEDGVARWRPLELGGVVGAQVIVLRGLAVGDEVVTLGHRELVDGDPVIVGRRGRCCVDGRVDYAGPTSGGQARAMVPAEPPGLASADPPSPSARAAAPDSPGPGEPAEPGAAARGG